MSDEKVVEQPRSLLVRMKEEFGFENLTALKNAYNELTDKDKDDLVASFNAEGKPTKR
jgi:hypothetical protein